MNLDRSFTVPRTVSREGLAQLAHVHQQTHTAPPSGTCIAIRNLDFFYGSERALNGITLDIPDRRITALIGPSGCGKSTLIRVLNRVYDIHPGHRATGEVLFDGWNILDPETNLMALRRRIGMTFQRAYPFPMSIFDNIAFGLRLHADLSRAEIAQRVERALREAALWDEVKDKLRSPGNSLSGGQQQRLCIARAIVLDPEVLLFDEPCAALDPISTNQIEDLLDRLGRRYCVVIVTHNMQQAARVADQVAVMFMGELIEYGTAEQIFVAPRDRRTEAYLTGRYG